MRRFIMFCLLACASRAPAQQPAPGDVVRITPRIQADGPVKQTRFEAQWLRAQGDTAFVTVLGQERSYALDAMRRVEMRVQHRATTRGLIVGAVVGGVALGMFVKAVDEAFDFCGGLEGCESSGISSFAGGAVVGALAGGGIGALVGSLFKVTGWREVQRN